jgi:hypothetical protein
MVIEMDEFDACKADPLYWLQHCTRTYDNLWREKGVEPYKRFPDKPYMPKLFELFRTSRRLYLAKSRDMMVTWAVVGFGVHMCQFFEASHVIIQTQKLDKALDLVCGRQTPGYARTLWEQQEPWMKERCPLTKASEDMPGDQLTWANGSKFQGVPQGEDQVRQYHPSLVIFDEAAFLDGFGASLDAAEPVAAQIIAVSSAAPSVFGDMILEAFES